MKENDLARLWHWFRICILRRCEHRFMPYQMTVLTDPKTGHYTLARVWKCTRCSKLKYGTAFQNTTKRKRYMK